MMPWGRGEGGVEGETIPVSLAQPLGSAVSGGKSRIKLLYVICYPKRWPQAELSCSLLNRQQFELSVILLHASIPPLQAFLDSIDIPFSVVPFRGKRDLPRAVKQIYHHCKAHNIQIIHTHFMNACLSGLLAAKLAGVKVRIHTRHHAGPLPWSHRPPWGGLYDHWNNTLSSKIIAPSLIVEDTLVEIEGVTKQKVEVIYHGFRTAEFNNPIASDVGVLKEKYALTDGSGPTVGVVSRLESIKGVKYIITAFISLLNDFPRARLVLANARGQLQQEVLQQLSDIDSDRYRCIEFEPDVVSLYSLFDIFIHVPTGLRMEAFGQVYVEALMAGVPSIFTRSGIAQEFDDAEPVAVYVDCKNSEQIYQGMLSLLQDTDKNSRLIKRGYHLSSQKFDITTMVERLQNLYQSELMSEVG